MCQEDTSRQNLQSDIETGSLKKSSGCIIEAENSFEELRAEDEKHDGATPPNPVPFCLFLGGIAIFFLGASIGLIILQEQLVKSDDHFRFESFTVTAMFVYGYIRVLLHIHTLTSLRKLSKTFTRMSVDMQHDTAILLMDGFSNFLWLPIYCYVFMRLMQVADTKVFYDEVTPFAKVMIATYNIDRLLQLLVGFEWDRFVHHVCSCLSPLFVFWWFPTIGDPGVLAPASLEVFAGRAAYYWFVSLRFSRGYAMEAEKQGKWTDPTGIDRLFVPPNITSAIRRGRFVHYYRNVFAQFGLVVVLTTAYMVRYRSETTLTWQLLISCLAVLFTVIDMPTVRKVHEASQVKYWEEKVFASTLERDESSGTGDTNNIASCHSQTSTSSFGVDC